MHTCAERFVGWKNHSLFSDRLYVAALGMLNWLFSFVKNKFGNSYFEVLFEFFFQQNLAFSFCGDLGNSRIPCLVY